ncbi:hypothetical protein BGX23_001738 [Mortierella sp. AD031]|nr:hypothetical protein BGX23_001738 [Mortierella sp. AD031]
MDTTQKAIHPLDLPEIRALVASFLPKKDCVTCMRVSKEWSKDFAGAVWHTLDFNEDDSYWRIPDVVLAKYGHLIRRIVNLETARQAFAFQCTSVNSLDHIDFTITSNHVTRDMVYDVVRRNKSSLTSLEIAGEPLFFGDHEPLQDSRSLFVPLDVLAPGPNLTRLELSALCITRESFSTILQQSPNLRFLSLRYVLISTYHPSLDLFRHEGITELSASVDQVMASDKAHPDRPSLLVHFPCLEHWRFPRSERNRIGISMDSLRAALLPNCPRLKGVQFAASSEVVADLLDSAITGLELCKFRYMELDTIAFLALLGHQETLTSVVLTQLYSKIDPRTPDQNPLIGKLIGLLLRSCRRLEVLSIKGHQMDMAIVEGPKWVCEDLRELQVRFRGLQTAATVDNCLKQLVASKSGRDPELFLEKGSVGERVCRHLLQFQKLKTIWMGTKNYYLPTSRQ